MNMIIKEFAMHSESIVIRRVLDSLKKVFLTNKIIIGKNYYLQTDGFPEEYYYLYIENVIKEQFNTLLQLMVTAAKITITAQDTSNKFYTYSKRFIDKAY